MAINATSLCYINAVPLAKNDIEIKVESFSNFTGFGIKNGKEKNSRSWSNNEDCKVKSSQNDNGDVSKTIAFKDGKNVDAIIYNNHDDIKRKYNQITGNIKSTCNSEQGPQD